MRPIESIELRDIEEARARIAGLALRTPLIRLNLEDAPAEIYLKLENLQPFGSFKVRGAGNVMRMQAEQLGDGVLTVSAGNMGQGVAFVARELGVRAWVVVPEHAPQTKIEAMERLGATVVKVPFDEWWSAIVTHELPGQPGLFIHPVYEPAVIAGHGTIGLEILEDCPDVDAVVIPYGGGGLSSGIASVLKAKKPDTKIYAAEVDTAAPLAASLVAGRPVSVDHTPSFVDGIGGKSILPEMWPLVSRLIDDSIVVSLEEIAATIRLLAERNRVIAEGAGAAAVAAALTGRAGKGKIVCVVSGGNIDIDKLVAILRGNLP